MEVYWLEQTEADVPAENDWLGESEAVHMAGLRFPKRRADWRLGRWTAKRALAGYLNFPSHPQALAAIEIRPAPDGAPEVFFANQPATVTISLSHRAGRAACAIAQPGAALGCDLEIIEQRSEAFMADYFTTEEQALARRAPPADQSWLLTLLWSAKESGLKALRTGLRLDTRCVVVNPVDALRHPDEDGEGCTERPALTVRPYSLNTWRALHVQHTNGPAFHGWWQETGNLLRTLVAAPRPGKPILLKGAGL